MVNFVATTHPLGQKRCRRVLRLPECQFYRKGVGALLTPFCRLLKSEMAPDTNASWRDDGYAAHPIVLIIGSLSSESGFFDAQTGGSCRKCSCSTLDQRQNTGIFAGERKEECMKEVSWNATPLYRRWECTEHGHGNRDQSRLLRKVEVRDMCGWYLECCFVVIYNIPIVKTISARKSGERLFQGSSFGHSKLSKTCAHRFMTKDFCSWKKSDAGFFFVWMVVCGQAPILPKFSKVGGESSLRSKEDIFFFSAHRAQVCSTSCACVACQHSHVFFILSHQNAVVFLGIAGNSSDFFLFFLLLTRARTRVWFFSSGIYLSTILTAYTILFSRFL